MRGAVRWLLCLATVGLPAAADAQSVGMGPRFSVVRGDTGPAADPTRLIGGTIRIQSSKHIALEGALDYRSEFSEDRASRFRETPLQASILLFPVRATFSPYLLGGLGLYSTHVDSLDATGEVLETVTERRRGWHLGLGAELFVLRRGALFVDYRWRFVRFGTPEPDGEPIDIPGLDGLEVSHRGSMWTSGMAFYF
jgi:hypothetical protein